MSDAESTTMIPIGILTPDGVQAAPYRAASLAEAVQFEPPGVYTVGRTYKRIHTLLFDEHMARLEESARLEGIPFRLDRVALRHAMRQLIDRSGYDESRFRITVPRGAPDTAIISLEAFTPPSPELIENGVRVITVRLARHNPSAKTTEWMTARKAATSTFGPGVYEGILVGDDGRLLEGTSSNFYTVADGAIYTAGEGVLRGMAQRVVMQVAPQVAPITWEAPRGNQLWALDEAFLTSASRGVIPVVIIDSQIIATGRPGPITLRLRDAYEAWAEAHLEVLA